RLSYDNSSPRPPEEFNSKNSNAEIESFSPSPIPNEDSDSFMEEIDLFLDPDDPMLPNRFCSFKPGLSHRCRAFKKFNTHCSHLNEWPMIINGKNITTLDVLLLFPKDFILQVLISSASIGNHFAADVFHIDVPILYAFTNEMVANVDVLASSMKNWGGFWVRFKFTTKEVKKEFHSCTTISSWFSQIQQATCDFTTDGRVSWVEIEDTDDEDESDDDDDEGEPKGVMLGDSDVEAVPDTMFEVLPNANRGDAPSVGNKEMHSEDPFNIYDILKVKKYLLRIV
nr:nucleotide-binding alpha-beta plait domain-containing protein [Tanacetum cinerariifolium]